MTSAPISLEVSPRDTKASRAKDLRQAERVPGVLYGFNVKNQPVDCSYQGFHKVYLQAGESTVIELKVMDSTGSPQGSKTVPVLIHEMSFDPVTGKYAHVDFYAVDMSKEVTAQIPIRTVGEAPGVKDLGGVLVRNRDSITVKCLPKYLPHDIEIDLSALENFHDTITLADIKVPANVTVEEKPDEILASVQPPRKEEEEEKPAAEVPAGEVPVEGEVPAEVAEGEATEEEEKEAAKKGKEKGGKKEEKKE